jgi:hypothetical protein
MPASSSAAYPHQGFAQNTRGLSVPPARRRRPKNIELSPPVAALGTHRREILICSPTFNRFVLFLVQSSFSNTKIFSDSAERGISNHKSTVRIKQTVQKNDKFAANSPYKYILQISANLPVRRKCSASGLLQKQSTVFRLTPGFVFIRAVEEIQHQR